MHFNLTYKAAKMYENEPPFLKTNDSSFSFTFIVNYTALLVYSFEKGHLLYRIETNLFLL